MKNKYILYMVSESSDVKQSEYDCFEDAKIAYENCGSHLRFLYQPNKTYFIGTLSSTGYKIGHDHQYHKDTAKCTGLFIAENKNQIKKFLDKANWHHGNAFKSSKARLYGNRGYGSLYRNDEDGFEYELIQNYLSSFNINYSFMLDSGFGAVDIETYKERNPYRLY